jgi:uracil-DNA glycosylase
MQTVSVRATAPAEPAAQPTRDCPLCPRLVALRGDIRVREPSWFNAPVPDFGERSGRLAIVGLAPGLRGANRTGRPFTGDFAGHLLYRTLLAFDFARGVYQERPDDGLTLVDCRIVNSVHCVPPENKPTPAEIRTCGRAFLQPSLAAMPRLSAIVALGRIAHDSVLRSLGLRLGASPFSHGARHPLRIGDRPTALTLFDSYHCSRYNTNTGVLTEDMFRAVFGQVRAMLDSEA